MTETQNASAFALVGANLVANGYSAIPIDPMGKRPDPCLGMEWQRFCKRLPTQLEVDVWSKRSVGVGIALGAASRGLIAIDIDSEDLDVIEAIESRWPSTVRKVGRTGYTAFYWASPAVRARSFRRSGGGGVDLLAHGRQSVMPPSIHPTTLRAVSVADTAHAGKHDHRRASHATRRCRVATRRSARAIRF